MVLENLRKSGFIETGNGAEMLSQPLGFGTSISSTSKDFQSKLQFKLEYRNVPVLVLSSCIFMSVLLSFQIIYRN